MVKEKVTVKDYEKISTENEYFLWHFTSKTSSTYIRPYFDVENPKFPNPLKVILESIPIPYFESKIEDSYDFVMSLGNIFIQNTYKNKVFNPVIVGFNRKRAVSNTFSHCYCNEGILEVIGELNPQFILNAII